MTLISAMAARVAGVGGAGLRWMAKRSLMVQVHNPLYVSVSLSVSLSLCLCVECAFCGAGDRAGRWAQAGATRSDDNEREFERLLGRLDAQRCELFLNGALVAEGDGSAVLGHPLNSLAWLANHLGSYGMGLAAGEVVTTGVVVNGLVNAREGDVVRADFGSLGTVEVLFEP